MDMKLLGVALIVVSCSMFGFLLASNFKREIKTLHDLIGILNFMECELNFKLTPLPQLCRSCAAQGNTLSGLFQIFADELEGQISPDISVCMKAAIAKCNSLSASVLPLLHEIGNSFGRFDLQGQLTGIEAARQNCRKQLEVLENGKEMRIRNYQTLGICAGAALAIILL